MNEAKVKQSKQFEINLWGTLYSTIDLAGEEKTPLKDWYIEDCTSVSESLFHSHSKVAWDR